MLACAAGLEDVVKVLLAQGADALATDLEGNTPLHYTYAYARMSLPSLLEAAGASMNACNFHQQDPEGVLGMGEQGLRPMAATSAREKKQRALSGYKDAKTTSHSTRK